MFNGIIFNQGIVSKITKSKKGTNLFLKSNLKIGKKDMGLSIACDGACLTLMNINNKLMEFYLSNETIERSKFKNLKVEDNINLDYIEILIREKFFFGKTGENVYIINNNEYRTNK